jgi:hypothetical protein
MWATDAVELVKKAASEREETDCRESKKAAIGRRYDSAEAEQHKTNQHNDARFPPALVNRVSKTHTTVRPNETELSYRWRQRAFASSFYFLISQS